jgi:hypothetical protein
MSGLTWPTAEIEEETIFFLHILYAFAPVLIKEEEEFDK